MLADLGTDKNGRFRLRSVTPGEADLLQERLLLGFRHELFLTQLAALADALDLTEDELRQIARHGFEASFMAPAAKQAALQAFAR